MSRTPQKAWRLSIATLYHTGEHQLGRDTLSVPIAESVSLLANLIAARYSALPQVEAVVLAGSHTTQVSEPDSDIDLYVYWHAEVPMEERGVIAETSAIHVEVNNQFWEPGDEWIDEATGIHVDVMFRHTRWIEEQLERVLGRYEASVGYSTCFWHNIITSKLLFDRSGWFSTLQINARQPYPDELRHRIVAKNYPILRDSMSSYLNQLRSAIRRCDKVSINHRITAFLASYFDIIFAVNRFPHPGEKRILQIAESQCKELPAEMQDQVHKFMTASSSEGVVTGYADALVDGLDELLQKQGLLESQRDR